MESPTAVTILDVFSGMANIGITPDNRVSVFDLITVIGGQKNPWSALERRQKEVLGRQKEVLGNPEDLPHTMYKFGGSGQRKTPVVDMRTAVHILNVLPGEAAAAFRNTNADIILRVYGGGTTLKAVIDEMNDFHNENPDSAAAPFRTHVLNSGNGAKQVKHTQRHVELLEKYKYDQRGLYLAIVDDGLYKFGHTEHLVDSLAVEIEKTKQIQEVQKTKQGEEETKRLAIRAKIWELQLDCLLKLVDKGHVIPTSKWHTMFKSEGLTPTAKILAEVQSYQEAKYI
ncbi:hypothetical protein HDU81_010274 [Chytriomyces hyalinus]|nr:hypothetical protein HDU81_010274 [Chytriomyces hyalinus]